MNLQPWELRAECNLGPCVAVPALMSPMVTVPPGWEGVVLGVKGTVDVTGLSPSGPDYRACVLKNGVVTAEFGYFVEVVGLIEFAATFTSPVVVAAEDTLEVRIDAAYAPTGTVSWASFVVYVECQLVSVQPACTPDDDPTTAYTADDIRALLSSTADSTYLDPLIQAGDGNGLEVYNQLIEQLVRVSKAIERTTQAMYLKPWSGQSCAEAHGGRKAEVPLAVQRTKLIDQPVVISADIRVQPIAMESGDPVGFEVYVPRFYSPTPQLVLNPGEAASVFAKVYAADFGYGYNNPSPESITHIEQIGTGLSNTRGTVSISGNTVKLDGYNEPDTFVPQHVGQYVRMTGGANEGNIARVIGYVRPDLAATSPTSGSIILERVFVFRCPIWGPLGRLRFIEGEAVYQPGTLARGTVLKQSGVDPYFTLTIVLTSGWFEVGAGRSLIGAQSGAFAILDPALFPDISTTTPAWVAEAATAEWEILDWIDVWGLTVSNPVCPSGGRAAWLDLLAAERGIYRLVGEDDTVFRKRTDEIADVVCPNAIKRTMQQVLLPLGVQGTFREIGTIQFPGFFFDCDAGEAPAHSFAYDMDPVSRPEDRWKLLVDYSEMRAFFVISLPRQKQGDFGFAYDDHPYGAFDTTPYPDFFDGFPWLEGRVYRQLWDTIGERKAAGVSYAFEIE